MVDWLDEVAQRKGDGACIVGIDAGCGDYGTDLKRGPISLFTVGRGAGALLRKDAMSLALPHAYTWSAPAGIPSLFIVRARWQHVPLSLRQSVMTVVPRESVLGNTLDRVVERLLQAGCEEVAWDLLSWFCPTWVPCREQGPLVRKLPRQPGEALTSGTMEAQPGSTPRLQLDGDCDAARGISSEDSFTAGGICTRVQRVTPDSLRNVPHS